MPKNLVYIRIFILQKSEFGLIQGSWGISSIPSIKTRTIKNIPDLPETDV